MKLRLFPESIALVIGLLCCGPALAAGFGAGIAPSKFELRAKPGAVLRDTVVVLNAAEKAANYAFHTADWTLNDQQGVEYVEATLAEDSCRPWVKLERPEITVSPGGRKRYRFEVHVPEDATAGLCKFAIIISPGESATASVGENDEIQFPVVGRYAVTVYVTVGDAKADVELEGFGEQVVGGQRLPTLLLTNKGNTLDRVFGELIATDATGTRYTLVPSTFPVLPGRTESIPLAFDVDPNRVGDTKLVYPLKLKGRIEIGGRTFKIDEENWGGA